MNPWIGKSVLLAGMILLIVIRVPHERRSKSVTVSESHKGWVERALLFGMGLGYFVLPVAAMAQGLSFADYELNLTRLVAGALLMIASLWLFARSHADLGTNWSVTLELREEHRIVERGVYQYIRHPMYTSIFLYAFAQWLLLSNWIAGPACLVAFTLMFALRLHPEEQMMLKRFGAEYESYRARTKRLVPKIW